MEELLNDQKIASALAIFVLSTLALLTAKFKEWREQSKLDLVETTEKLNGIKRSSLRNEYLQIFNSKVFTTEQKYGLTRTIIREYKKLNGNSYIDTLEQELEDMLLNEVK